MKEKTFYENLQSIVISELMKTEKEVTILMAWLNFDIYYNTFYELLKRQVRIKIILDNNKQNFKQLDKIQKLRNLGAKISFYKYSGIMHFKDALIDDKILLTGSFNWTKNANLRNKERLEVKIAENIQDEICFLEELRQYYQLCFISSNDVKTLKRITPCTKWCGLSKVVLVVPIIDNDFQVTFHFFSCCQCQTEEITAITYPIYAWSERDDIINGIRENWDGYCDAPENFKINEIIDPKLEIFYIGLLEQFRLDNMPLVHGLAVIAHHDVQFDDGRAYFNVIWKYPEVKELVMDKYEINC